MTHYKVGLDILRGAGMGEGAWQTFCGVDTRVTMVDDYRHIPPCDADCAKLVVDCPVCKVIYDAISKDFVQHFISKDASQ